MFIYIYIYRCLHSRPPSLVPGALRGCAPRTGDGKPKFPGGDGTSLPEGRLRPLPGAGEAPGVPVASLCSFGDGWSHRGSNPVRACPVGTLAPVGCKHLPGDEPITCRQLPEPPTENSSGPTPACNAPGRRSPPTPPNGTRTARHRYCWFEQPSNRMP